ncbi:hypothetical protein ACVR0A_06745 [Streptococcus downei]|uniref:hypothetical protein n=1 Tax=Streptococcus downei TaxID=1317 RepID=UPI000E1B5FDF|nr:hypothetical protein [Streptococcus downei]
MAKTIDGKRRVVNAFEALRLADEDPWNYPIDKTKQALEKESESQKKTIATLKSRGFWKRLFNLWLLSNSNPRVAFLMERKSDDN